MIKVLKNLKNRYLFLYDIILVVLSYFVVTNIKEIGIYDNFSPKEWFIVSLSAIIFAGVLYIFGCYRVYWTYAGTRDYCRVIGACFCAAALTDILCSIYILGGFSFFENFISSGVASVGILGSRMMVRAIRRLTSITHSVDTSKKTKRVLIIGAGSLGVTLARDITMNDELNYYILGFIDDDKTKKHALIHGIEVLGNTSDLITICDRLEPDEIIFAISSTTAEERKRILNLCAQTNSELKIVAGFAESLLGRRSTDYIRKVNVDDLLGREKIVLDNSAIAGEIENNVIIVTGGGGSIGSELCRQIMKYMPKKLVVLDIYENNAFELEHELREKFPKGDVDIVVASVRDEDRIMSVFDKYKPHIVFHAAAHKHVPMMENNPMEAVKNNVFGTWNAARCAGKCGAKRFVLISTDKAVNPTNVMGATKRVCEMIVQALQTVSKKTEYVAVRFGNVLNSNGSVIPIFEKQIEKGGPVTVTHPDITRFFMTIPEAAQLVLQAASFAKGGEIFVLDMGEPVRIYDMAKNLIRLSGLQPEKDIKIVFSGLRPGEKLYEELLMNEEGLGKTGHDKIYVGKPFFDSMDELEEKLEILREAVATQDNEKVVMAVERVVPTYKRKKEEIAAQDGGSHGNSEKSEMSLA